MFVRLVCIVTLVALAGFSRLAGADQLRDPRAGDCANMIDPGSALYQSLYSSSHSTGVCRRVTVGGDHFGASVEVQVDRDPTRPATPPEVGLAPQLSYIRVTRIEANPTRPTEPNLNTAADGIRLHALSDKVSVTWGIGSVDATVFRLDIAATQTTNACLYGETWGSLGGYTLAEVCWSVNGTATDADVLRIAKEYVGPSFGAIRP